MVSKKENHRFIEANALLLAKTKQIKQTLPLLAKSKQTKQTLLLLAKSKQISLLLAQKKLRAAFFPFCSPSEDHPAPFWSPGWYTAVSPPRRSPVDPG